MDYYHDGKLKTIYDLKKSFRDTFLPAAGPTASWMLANNVLEVEPWPAIDPGSQVIEKVAGSEVGGKWRTYSIRSKTNDEKWVILKYKRDGLLVESDFTQLEDSPKDKQAWKTYRQALRDLPATYPNADDVVWPTQPVG